MKLIVIVTSLTKPAASPESETHSPDAVAAIPIGGVFPLGPFLLNFLINGGEFGLCLRPRYRDLQ